MSDTKAAKAVDESMRWLWRRHGEIMAAEKKALELLDKGDTRGHRLAMRDKAELVASLADEAAAYLASCGDLPAAMSAEIENALQPFSQSARAGLALDSVFYMSSLLYRDDPTKGEPDTLFQRLTSLGQSLGWTRG